MLTNDTRGKKPLDGIRILDCSWATGGPYGSLLLAFMGAEVIKIETPPAMTGVSTRQMLFPQFSHQGADVHFLTYNRNKKSIVINLRTEHGRDVFYDLVKKSDVVFDNFRPGVTGRLGIDYETLKEVNERIICCSLSGFGASGPDTNKAAFDTIIEASSGITSLLRRLLPQDAIPPSYPGISWADHVGGLGAAFAVVTALYARESTDRGQKLDIAMQDMLISMTGFLITATANFKSWEDPLQKMLWGAFKTSDDYVVLCGHREGMWKRLCQSLGTTGLMTNPRFDTHAKRLENGAELRLIIEGILLTKTTKEWLEILSEGDVPATAINDLDEVISSEQTAVRNMVPPMEHHGKTFRAPGNPIKLSDMVETFEAPPDLGEHTREILSEVLGYSSEQIDELKRANIVT